MLIVSITSEASLYSTVAAIKTMDVSKDNWKYASGRFIEEVRSQTLALKAEGMAATVTSAAVRRGMENSDSLLQLKQERVH